MTSKFDDAKNRARGAAPATEPPTAEKPDVFSTVVLESLNMEEFAEAIASGTATLGERFLEIAEGQQFRGFYLGTSQGVIEELQNVLVDGKSVTQAVLKPVTRLHFEAATKDRVGIGITVSLLEYAQLKNQITDVLPPDGSAMVLVGKGAMGRNKKGTRQLQQWMVARFLNVRPARKRLGSEAPAAGSEIKPS